MFAKKVVLTKRIRWFEDSTGSASFNRYWMIWTGSTRASRPSLMRAASQNIRARVWLGVGRPTSSTRVPVLMPGADSADAAGAFSNWWQGKGRLTVKTHRRTREGQCEPSGRTY
jgi:hypothetical protein